MNSDFGKRLLQNPRLPLLALGAALLSFALAGCSKGQSELITIRGSNTIGEELAPRLVAEFRKEHPEANFDMEFKGTTYGMGALLAGRSDIAAASRPASTNELELAKPRGVELNEYVIGTYSVAVLANAKSPVANLSLEQVRDIFTGAITNWATVGGPEAAIHLCVRDPVSGTYLGFQELAMENKPYGHSLKAFTNYAAIVQAIAEDPNAVGYTSLEAANRPGVKLVSIGGVMPSATVVDQGKYPYARLLRLYTDKNRERGLTRDFIRLVQSEQGKKVIQEAGYVPHQQ